MRDGIWDGIYANLITTSLLFGLSLMAYLLFRAISLRKRAKLLACFGVSSSNPTLGIYVSRIMVRGCKDTDAIEDLVEGHIGPCISKPEYEAALALRALIFLRWFPVFPQRVEQWLTKKYFAIVALEPTIEISPPADSKEDEFLRVMSSNLVVVGGNVYNSLSKRLFNSPASILLLKKEIESEQAVIHKPSGQVYHSRSQGRELAIVQRISMGRSVVIQCAGTGAGATAEAVRYFAGHWREHWEIAQGGDFGLILDWREVANFDEAFYREPDHVYPWYRVSAPRKV